MFRTRAFKSILPYLAATGDLFLVFAGFLAAFHFRFLGQVPVFNQEPFVQIMPWVGLVTIILFAGLGLYQFQNTDLTSLFRGVITGILGVTTATMALTFWFRGFAFPRSVLVLGAFILVVVVCVWRFFFWHLERWVYGERKLLVVGNPAEVVETLDKLPDLTCRFFKVQNALLPEDISKLPVLLPQIDTVLVLSTLSREEKASVLTACLEARREVYVVPDLYDIMLNKSNMLQLDDLLVVGVQDIRLNMLQRVTKRALDLVLAGLGMILLAPVLIACALAVAISSPGPVFYTQERVGFRGRTFFLYKFRTMIKDAEKITGPVLAGDKDPRITGAGRILRLTRLDELPQLINVFKGNMSFVGPRPERPFFVNRFVSEIPDYRYRHLVKPGLTGLAQIYGKYTTSATDKLRYDLYYIRSYSLWLDLKIILQTIPVALGGQGAGVKKEKKKRHVALGALARSVGQTTSSRER